MTAPPNPFTQRLAGTLDEALRTARNLRVSLERTAGLYPIASADALDDEARERLDALRVRFCDLQDCLGRKLFRALVLYEELGVDELSTIDLIHRMEKRRIVASFDEWVEWRTLRNGFSHDYSAADAERAEALNALPTAAAGLLRTLEALRRHVAARHGIEI